MIITQHGPGAEGCASIRRIFHLEIEIYPALPPDPPPSSTTKSRLEDSLARSPPFPLLPSTNFIPPPSLPDQPSQPTAPSPDAAIAECGGLAAASAASSRAAAH